MALNNIPLVIPDIILVDTLNLALNAIRTDYANKLIEGRVDESLLYLLLNGNSIGNYNLLENAIKIFITTPQNPKHFDVKGSFDHNSPSAPQVYVTLPSENSKDDELSIGEGANDELIYPRDSEADQYRKQYMRRWIATYNVVIVCDNKNEMAVIYNVFKSLIIACIEHFSFEGLNNMKIGGQDLRMRDNIPDKTFHRAITISFEYEQVAPSLFIKSIFRTIRLYWKPEGAVTAQGPIEISTIDDLSESSSASI